MSDVMARKPLDTSDDTVRLTIRLTKKQLADVDCGRGQLSRSDYLRKLIDTGLWVDEPQPVEADKPPVQIMFEPPHRHKRAESIGVQYVKGTKRQTWRCTCGVVLT